MDVSGYENLENLCGSEADSFCLSWDLYPSSDDSTQKSAQISLLFVSDSLLTVLAETAFPDKDGQFDYNKH